MWTFVGSDNATNKGCCNDRHELWESILWYIDSNQRTIPDHFHWHIRPLNTSQPFQIIRTFGQKVILDNQLIIQNVEESFNQIKKVSMSIISHHG